jgi:hypothetical protein
MLLLIEQFNQPPLQIKGAKHKKHKGPDTYMSEKVSGPSN